MLRIARYWSTWYRQTTNLDRQRFGCNVYPCRQTRRGAAANAGEDRDRTRHRDGTVRGAVAQAPGRVDPRVARSAAVSGLGEVLRRDRLPGQGRRRHGPWVWRTSRPLPCRRSVRDGLTDWLLKPSHHSQPACVELYAPKPDHRDRERGAPAAGRAALGTVHTALIAAARNCSFTFLLIRWPRREECNRPLR
jgi:hypothetical protein